ncbi:hypothetical protein SELMODRAFT_411961 [Selaginella moellendorffii]|uniref:Uncharacterized protein n=1 Tax=Selaginella moellendorffii TaxID=88036 RepID=D8RJK9_SELML|nr:hypothetical protein SELMODRAFT_411961 [Selaginella moellendorffii]
MYSTLALRNGVPTLKTAGGWPSSREKRAPALAVSTYLAIPVTSTTRRSSGSFTSYGQQVERYLMLTSPELDIRSFVRVLRSSRTSLLRYSSGNLNTGFARAVSSQSGYKSRMPPSATVVGAGGSWQRRISWCGSCSACFPAMFQTVLTFDLYQLQSTIKELVQEEFDLYQLQSTIKEIIIETMKSKIEIPAIAAAAVRVSKSFLEMLLPAALLELELDDGGVVPLPFWGSDLESRRRSTMIRAWSLRSKCHRC